MLAYYHSHVCTQIPTPTNTHHNPNKSQHYKEKPRAMASVLAISSKSKFKSIIKWIEISRHPPHHSRYLNLISSVNFCVTKAMTHAFVFNCKELRYQPHSGTWNHIRTGWTTSAEYGTFKQWERFGLTVEKQLNIQSKSLLDYHHLIGRVFDWIRDPI